MNHLGRALTEYDDPPVNVLFVYNCNPAATVPDQRRIIRGLEREDLFTVVFEQVMTDTALYADVVLPATTFLEGYDFAKAYGPISLELGAAGHRRRRRSALERRRVRRAVRAARPAERRRADRRAGPDGRRCSTRCPGTIGDRSARRRVAGAAVRRRAGAVRRRVPEHAGPQGRSLPRGARRRARRSGSTASSRIRRPTRYPLALISPASERTISSTLGELPRPDVKLLMHPDDAAARGLADDDLVRVFNELGEVHCPLHVAPAIRPGHGQPAEGHLAPQHAQRRDRHRARARHADRSRRRRLLQRRARAGRVAAPHA